MARVLKRSKPNWVPGLFKGFWDQNAGKTGRVVAVTRGEYSGLDFYSVMFFDADGKILSSGAYLSHDIEIITAGFGI